MIRPHQGPSRLGVGLYSLAEAARIVGVPLNTIRGWASPREGLVPRHFDPAERTLTFVELMELHFIKMFRAENVSLQTLRKVSRAASQQFNTPYPFSEKRFETDGATVFAALIGEQKKDAVSEEVDDMRNGQLVFENVIRPFCRKLEYHGTREVARFWPLDHAGRVVLDPTRKFGKPIDAKTGIPTQTLYEAVKAGSGQSPASVAEWFDVPIAAVNAAVAFEQSLND